MVLGQCCVLQWLPLDLQYVRADVLFACGSSSSGRGVYARFQGYELLRFAALWFVGANFEP